MKPSHTLLLILVAVIWGFNFVAIKVGLERLPPVTYVMLRFLITSLPLLPFVRRPGVPLRMLAAYGLLAFAAQFVLLFAAIQMGLYISLASLVVQSQIFFTMAFAWLWLREYPRKFQVAGALIAAAGIGVIAWHVHTGGEITWPGLLLALCASACWAGGGIVVKGFGPVDMIGVIIWGSLFSAGALIPVALAVDGPGLMLHAASAMNGRTVVALLYTAYVSGLLGYTLWNRMMALHPANAVSPFGLLVPIFAIVSACLFLGEDLPLWKIAAAMLVMGGLSLNQFGGRMAALARRSFRRRKAGT